MNATSRSVRAVQAGPGRPMSRTRKTPFCSSPSMVAASFPCRLSLSLRPTACRAFTVKKNKQDKLIIKITSGKFWNKTLICLALSSPRPWFAATPVPWFSALFGAFSATFYLLDPDPYGGFGSRKSPIIQTRSVLDLHSRITTFEIWNRIF